MAKANGVPVRCDSRISIVSVGIYINMPPVGAAFCNQADSGLGAIPAPIASLLCTQVDADRFEV